MEPVQNNKHVGASAKGTEKRPAQTGGGSATRNNAKENERLNQLSSSLQKAYQTTLNEAVPDSMMDLLKKLG